MALDGETNLKEKSAVMEDLKVSEGLSQLQQKFHGSVICDQPNENLDYW